MTRYICSKIIEDPKLQGVLLRWAVNNVFFAFFLIWCIDLAKDGDIIAIYAGIGIAIFNSVSDVILTGHFYGNPYRFIEDLKKPY